jgi:two-component system cell cycle response regulator
MRARVHTVLVVDDNVSNVKMLEAKLLDENFDVRVAFDGLEALAHVEAHAFDLVLLDVMLPGIDGFEVCRRLRQHPRGAQLPIVMLTALDTASGRALGASAGADDYFVKPVEDEILFRRLSDLLGVHAPIAAVAAGSS